MKPRTSKAIIGELSSLLTQGNAHVPFEVACADVPAGLLNKPVPELPYTVWQLAEHIRIAQWDIVEFCLNPRHISPPWPEGYWPSNDVDEATWQATLAQIQQDRDRFLELLHDSHQDLLAPLPTARAKRCCAKPC